jgi:NAD(P)-dependent dehydrogenase (short-subunit alcohol dehydrogenase family)
MNKRIVVIGGSSGMGLAVARMALADGAEVIIAGRSTERLNAARSILGEDRLEIAAMDIGNQPEVAALFDRVGQFDHLVITAANLAYGPVLELKEDDLMRGVRSKLLGALFAVQEGAARIRPGGSITFTSGIAAKRPMRGGAVAAAINSGLEGMARSLAIELAPTRVNVVSPGWTDTPIWDGMTGMTKEKKQEAHSSMAARLPVGKIGRAEDIAEAVMFLMKNKFTTGMVLDVDGGHRLV